MLYCIIHRPLWSLYSHVAMDNNNFNVVFITCLHLPCHGEVMSVSEHIREQAREPRSSARLNLRPTKPVTEMGKVWSY